MPRARAAVQRPRGVDLATMVARSVVSGDTAAQEHTLRGATMTTVDMDR